MGLNQSCSTLFSVLQDKQPLMELLINHRKYIQFDSQPLERFLGLMSEPEWPDYLPNRPLPQRLAGYLTPEKLLSLKTRLSQIPSIPAPVLDELVSVDAKTVFRLLRWGSRVFVVTWPFEHVVAGVNTGYTLPEYNLSSVGAALQSYISIPKPVLLFKQPEVPYLGLEENWTQYQFKDGKLRCLGGVYSETLFNLFTHG